MNITRTARRLRLPFALALVALASIALLRRAYGDGEHPTPSDQPPPAADFAAAAEDEPERARAVAPTTVAGLALAQTVELPAPDTPLADSFAVLDAEARRGNAEAACRLVAEIDRCGHAYINAKAILVHARRTELGAAADETAVLTHADRLAVLEDAVERFDRLCAGSDGLPRLHALRYLAVAADAGHRDSMLQYLRPDRLQAAALIDDPSLIAHYRERAARYLLAGLEAGDLRFVRYWMEAVKFSANSPLFRALPPHLRSEGALIAFLIELPQPLRDSLRGVPMFGGSTARPSAAERAFASQLAQAHFAGAQPLAPEQTMYGTSPEGYRLQMTQALEIEESRCTLR